MSNQCVVNISISTSCIPDTDGTLFQFVVVDIDEIIQIREKIKQHPNHTIMFGYRNVEDYVKCEDISITLFKGETYLNCFKKFTKNSSMESYPVFSILKDFCENVTNKEKFVKQLKNTLNNHSTEEIIKEGWNAFKQSEEEWNTFLKKYDIKKF
jgi:hypothetical protein